MTDYSTVRCYVAVGVRVIAHSNNTQTFALAMTSSCHGLGDGEYDLYYCEVIRACNTTYQEGYQKDRKSMQSL